MIKHYEFIKVLIESSFKKYLYHSIMVIILCLIFHIVYYNLHEMKYIRLTLNSIKATNLYRADLEIKEMNNLDIEVNNLLNRFPQNNEFVSLCKKNAFIDETYNNKQININFLSENEIQQYNYSVTKGIYFDKHWESETIYQAIIPQELSGKYELGKSYTIDIVKNFATFKTIEIKIIGVRNNNYILDSSAGMDHIYRKNNTILVFDKYNLISPYYYNENNSIISLLINNKESINNEIFISQLKEYGLRNITNTEQQITKSNKLTYREFHIYAMMLMLIIPMMLLSITCFLYLEFQNKKRNYFVFFLNGLAPSFLWKSLFLLNLFFITFPHIICEFFWYFTCTIIEIKFVWQHTLISFLIDISSVLTITTIFAFYASRIRYDHKMLNGKEINCE